MGELGPMRGRRHLQNQAVTEEPTDNPEEGSQMCFCLYRATAREDVTLR